MAKSSTGYRATLCNSGALAVITLLASCGGSGSIVPDAPPATSVTIKRDSYGVPHVYADDSYALFYGYAYALAEDRLFQLDMMRRSINGTTAAVLGAGEKDANVKYDKDARSNLRPDLIDKQLATLKPADRAIFNGYAAGVNARVRDVLASRNALLPKQYVVLGFDPAPWTALDVAMIWVGSAAARYSDANAEIGNLGLLKSLQSRHGGQKGQQIFDQVRWANDLKATTTVPRENARVAPTAGTPSKRAPTLAAPSRALLESLERSEIAKYGGSGPDFTPRASNLWVAAPSKTTGGETVFINGPQQGYTNPSYVTGAGLHGAGFNVVGNTPLGWPYLVFATNGTATWGATAGPLDLVDMYQLQLNPADSRQYLYKGSYRPLDRRVEKIEVRGAPSVEHEVFTSVHGLVTAFDTTKGIAYAKRRSWEGIEIQSLLAYIKSMKAQSWEEFLEASEPIGISNNRYYADVKGTIGYVSVGRVPVRPAGQDFRLPAEGTGTMEWQGFKPFSANPQVINPKQGYLTNWNNQPSPEAGSTDANFWSVADRVVEFNVQFEQKKKFTPEEIWKFNYIASFMDTELRYFKPYIAQALQRLPENSVARNAGQLVVDWNGMTVDLKETGFYDSPAVTIFRRWLSNMVRKTLETDIPAANLAAFTNVGDGTRVSMGAKVAYNALLGVDAGVQQTVDFFHGQDKYDIVAAALVETVNQLTGSFGPDMAAWRTPARAHEFSSNNFLQVPQALPEERLAFPVAQNRGTQNHRVTFGAGGDVSICDVAPPGQNGFVAPSGERSAHYSDQLELYRKFDCKPQWINPQDVSSNTRREYKLNIAR